MKLDHPEFARYGIYYVGSNADSVVIKFRSDGNERLLYDFNLEVGSML